MHFSGLQIILMDFLGLKYEGGGGGVTLKQSFYVDGSFQRKRSRPDGLRHPVYKVDSFFG